MITAIDELNAISIEHGFAGTAPKTIAGAIDALADTLAGASVDRQRTVADAIHSLAPYIGSGGGGAAVLGSTQMAPSYQSAVPVVGEVLNNPAPFGEYDLLLGDTVVVPYCNAYSFAAGLTVVYRSFHEVSGAYVVGTSFDSKKGLVVTEVEPFTDYTFERSDSETGTLSFVMPDIVHSGNKGLIFVAT